MMFFVLNTALSLPAYLKSQTCAKSILHLRCSSYGPESISNRSPVSFVAPAQTGAGIFCALRKYNVVISS